MVVSSYIIIFARHKELWTFNFKIYGLATKLLIIFLAQNTVWLTAWLFVSWLSVIRYCVYSVKL